MIHITGQPPPTPAGQAGQAGPIRRGWSSTQGVASRCFSSPTSPAWTPFDDHSFRPKLCPLRTIAEGHRTGMRPQGHGTEVLLRKTHKTELFDERFSTRWFCSRIHKVYGIKLIVILGHSVFVQSITKFLRQPGAYPPLPPG